MSDKKRILINPAFLKSSSFRKTIKKKEKPTIPIKASTLKQKLIAKVKEKNKITQANQTREKKQKECFIQEDEFNKSLSYLQEKIKKQKHKQRLKENNNKPYGSNNITSNNISLKNVIDNLNISNKENCETFVIRPDPPHGCLKNGKKPTYRSYNGIKNPIKNPHGSLKISNHKSSTKNNTLLNPFFERQKKLKKLKKLKNLSAQKKIRRKTIKIRRTLGKDKNRKVNILIKNNTSRRQIENEKNLLKSATLTEIKQYLKKQGVLKHGSTAPGEILREMYESCILTGEVENTGGKVLLHNYFNEET